MLLVAAIVALAMGWVQNSHTRAIHEGRVWFELWGTHGVHTFDLVVLVSEGVLVTGLIIMLCAGFSRRRR